MIQTLLFSNKTKLVGILFCFSLFTAGVIVNGVGILSPAYLSLAFVSLAIIIFSKSLKSKYLQENLIFFLLSDWFFLEIFINPTGDIKTGLFLIVTSLSYPIFDLFCKKIKIEDLKKYSIKYIHFVILLYLFELSIRLVRCNFSFSSLTDPMFFARLFYLYKENLIIGGGDTNFIATHLLITFFFAFYLNRRFQVKLGKELLVLVFLLFFAFSRAGWLSVVFGTVSLSFIHKRNRNKISLFRLEIMMFLILIVLVFLFSALSYDGSFETKIEIWTLTLDFLKNASLRDLLLGLGFLNSIQVVKFNVAHTLISTLIMDTGLISLFLYFSCWIPVLKQSRGFALYILIPIFIFALSFIQQMIPYLYITLAIISNLEQKKCCQL